MGDPGAAATASVARKNRVPDASDKVGEVFKRTAEKSLFAAYIDVTRGDTKSTPSEDTVSRIFTLTPFYCRYIGFLHSISETVRQYYGSVVDGLHSMEQMFIKRCRLNNIFGIACKNILNVLAEMVNGVQYEEVRNLAGWSFSAMDTSARTLLIMEDANYAVIAGQEGDRPLGRGELFGSLVAIYRCVDLCDRIQRTRRSGAVQRLLGDLKRYLLAFATALMRTIVLHTDTIRAKLERDIDGRLDAPMKLRCAALRALLQYASRLTSGSRSGCIAPASDHVKWQALIELLSKYEYVTKERVMSETTYHAAAVSASAVLRERYTMLNIIERLQHDCSSAFLDSIACLMPGQCDTNFLTIRTDVAASDPHSSTSDMHMRELHDPAVATTLCLHNRAIKTARDSLPVTTDISNYHRLNKMNASETIVEPLSLSMNVVVLGVTNHEERRFVFAFVTKYPQDFMRFITQGCCVSPGNIAMWLRCLNFEHMDTRAFLEMYAAMYSCAGLPVPRTTLVMYHPSSTRFRMAMNVFYHTYFSRALGKGPEYHLYDGAFFERFGAWLGSMHQIEYTIPYRVPAVLVSQSIVSSNMYLRPHATTSAAITRLNMDQRSLTTTFNQIIRDVIEDESELNVLTKGFLEMVILRAYKGVFRSDYITTCRFISNTAFRLFLSKCKSLYADEINISVPNEDAFIMRLITAPLSEADSEEVRRQRETARVLIDGYTRAGVDAFAQKQRRIHLEQQRKFADAAGVNPLSDLTSVPSQLGALRDDDVAVAQSLADMGVEGTYNPTGDLLSSTQVIPDLVKPPSAPAPIIDMNLKI